METIRIIQTSTHYCAVSLIMFKRFQQTEKGHLFLLLIVVVGGYIMLFNPYSFTPFTFTRTTKSHDHEAVERPPCNAAAHDDMNLVRFLLTNTSSGHCLYAPNVSVVGSSEECAPLNQLAFIKTHKTGSTTLRLIVDMYGYYRNLSYMLNKKDSKSGHIRNMKISRKNLLPPINVTSGDYDRYIHNFDMCSVHYKYDRNMLDLVMKNGSKYITILRDPVTHFVSAFVFFGTAKKVAGVTMEDKINNWMTKPGESTMLNNNQMLDLGFSKAKFSNPENVSNYIERVAREFDLVLLTEYFDESLILLRKMMCWSYDDILYLKQNVRSGDKKPLHQTVQNKIRRHNAVDVKLYNHFNATLWRKVADYGQTFRADLEHFRKRLDELYGICVGGLKPKKIPTRGSLSRMVYTLSGNASDYCVLMTNRDRNTFKKIWKRQKLTHYT